MEICTTLQNGSWGYKKWASWKSTDRAMQMLESARKSNANLLLNVGPKGDGSIAETADQTLREIGRRIRKQGSTRS
jgi:alpha-L-fucosidase